MRGMCFSGFSDGITQKDIDRFCYEMTLLEKRERMFENTSDDLKEIERLNSEYSRLVTEAHEFMETARDLNTEAGTHKNWDEYKIALVEEADENVKCALSLLNESRKIISRLEEIGAINNYTDEDL